VNRRKAGEAEASARVAKDYATQTAYLKLARELRRLTEQ
jgi:hypothetical protein